jgi:hypothetical protein
MKPTRLVASTKLSERDFWNRSLLGKSLLAFPDALRPELWIRFDNAGRWGLPEIYNKAIESCPDGRHLLFVHDDVFLHDVFLQHRIDEGLGLRCHVLGLAGSRGSDLAHPSWGLAFDEHLKPTGWQSGGIVLSGAVSHISRYHDPAQEVGVVPKPLLSIYGALPARCDLLDGLFLAVHGSVVRDRGVRFDERLRYHLYDLDFCRSASAAGLALSTWPILVSHGSGGNFGDEEFRAAARIYLEKWKPTEPAAKIVGTFPDPGPMRCDFCEATIPFAGLSEHSAQHRDDAARSPAAGSREPTESSRCAP